MGFSGVPPRPELALEIATIQKWATRADAAIMSDEVPWDSLLAGGRADSIVLRNQLPLGGYESESQARARALGFDLRDSAALIGPAEGGHARSQTSNSSGTQARPSSLGGAM
jgi:hypothetical protein